MVEARLGHADADQPLARHHHRDPRATSRSSASSRWRSRPRTRRSSCCRSTSSARIEFDKKRIYFFAALFESRIVFLTHRRRDGPAASRSATTPTSSSASAVSTRASRRRRCRSRARAASRVDLLNTPVARVRIEGYFAVTSNTVQFGARVELFFGLDILNVQGHLAFDALFQFSPFHFIIEISASLLGEGVRRRPLLGRACAASLEGPGALAHRRATARSRCCSGTSTSTSRRPGARATNDELPPIAVLPMLDARAGQGRELARAPAGRRTACSSRCARCRPRKRRSILHPLGILHVSQRRCPARAQARQGRQPEAERRQPPVAGASPAAACAKKDDAFEHFAPAQFQNFSDADKLSRPAFAPERSGLELSLPAGGNIRSSDMVKRVVRYEEIILDTNFKRFAAALPRLRWRRSSTSSSTASAAARCELSQATKAKAQPVRRQDRRAAARRYTVAFQPNNKAVRRGAPSPSTARPAHATT